MFNQCCSGDSPGRGYLRYEFVVLSVVDKRTNLANSLSDYVEKIFTPDGGRSAKFDTVISRSTVVPQTQEQGKTLFQTHKNHKVTEQYRELAVEVEARMAKARSVFDGASLDDADTIDAIAYFYRSAGQLLDPHSAIGAAIAREKRTDAGVPVIALATAHAAKFPDAVERATGVKPTLPPKLGDLLERPEHCTVLPNDLDAVQTFIRDSVSLAA